jgi:phosphatidylserine/phosphatidylglycerophosphate/cardiolipin synthase-like enzyme
LYVHCPLVWEMQIIFYMVDRLRKTSLILLTLFTLVFSTGLFPLSTLSQENQTTWEVYFSPRGQCTDAIIRELNKAKNSVLVQAYSFTSVPIAEALVNAHKRGVKVEVILDKNRRNEKKSSAPFLSARGVQVKIDATRGIAHNKVMIIDGEIVITGSFNFTKRAEEKNAENLLIIHDRKLAEKYAKNWLEHAQYSNPYMENGATKERPVLEELVQEKDEVSGPER